MRHLSCALTLALIATSAMATETENHGISILPAKTPPVIDGDAKDWDLSGGVFVCSDVENLREHYRQTLRHWVARLEAHGEKARLIVGEATYRVWRLTMAGSAHGFRTGQLAVYQALLAKPDPAGDVHLPLTRGDWYG